jgi:hypothetical protein
MAKHSTPAPAISPPNRRKAKYGVIERTVSRNGMLFVCQF